MQHKWSNKFRYWSCFVALQMYILYHKKLLKNEIYKKNLFHNSFVCSATLFFADKFSLENATFHINFLVKILFLNENLFWQFYIHVWLVIFSFSIITVVDKQNFECNWSICNKRSHQNFSIYNRDQILLPFLA